MRVWLPLMLLTACATPPSEPPPTATFFESAARWSVDGLDFMAVYQHPAAWLQEMTLISPSGREWTAWQIVNDYSYASQPRITFGVGIGTGVGRNPRFSVGTGIVFNSPPPPEVLRGLIARFRLPDFDPRPGWQLRATFVSPYGSFATIFPIKPPTIKPEKRPDAATNVIVSGDGRYRVTYDPSKDESVVVLEEGSMKLVCRYSGETHEFRRPVKVRITGSSINVE